jgi:hypothetical protein
MRIFGYDYHESEDPWAEAPSWAVELREMMALVLRTDRRMESEMQLAFTKMIAATAAQTTVTNGAVQALQSLGAKIADLSTQLAAANSANDPVAQAAVQTQLDGLAQGVSDNDDKIAAAIATPGTVTTPTPTPTPIPTA